MSMSVNAASSSSTSRNPSARQNRLATSSGMSVRSGHLGLGQAVPGRDQHAVDDQQVEDVVLDGPVDLLVGAAQIEQQEAHPGQGLDPVDVRVLVLGVGRVVRHPPTLGRVTPCGVRSTGAYTGRVDPPRSAPGEHRPRPGARGPSWYPIKAFHEAKGRLDHALTASERADLARSMAAQVVEAAAPLPVAVVCDDNEVADWARVRGALVVWEPGRGLNGAVEAGVEHLRDAGVAHVTVSHADLPRAEPHRRRGLGAGHHPGARPLRQRHQRDRRPDRRRLPVLLRAGLVRPAPGRGRTDSACRCGCSTSPTWPGTSTSPATWSRRPPRASLLRDRRRPGPRIPLRSGRRPDSRPATSSTRRPSPSTCQRRRSRWPSAPTPTTSSSAPGPRSPSGRRPGAASTTSSSPTAPRAVGTPTTTSGVWWRARMQECREAAARIDGTTATDGDRVRFLGAVDGELVNDIDARREVARVIREVRPDVLFGHDPWRRYRLHPDHRAAGFLTLDALVAARDPHFFPELGARAAPPDGPPAVGSRSPQPRRAHGGLRRRQGRCPDVPPQPAWRAPWVSPPHDGPATSARQMLAARIGWQLAQHGAVAGLDSGEAFHLIDQL